MMTEIMDTNTQRDDLENQVWSAIAAFEQIVETIPDDRVSLEALSHAYEQVGDLSRARDYLTRLIDQVIKDNDHAAAGVLQERVVRFAVSDPIAREIQTKLDAFLATAKPVAKEFDLSETSPEEAAKKDEADQRGAHVAAELAFAWTLFQAGELSQEEYASVAQDLGATTGNDVPVSISVLHALQDRRSRNIDRILAFAAKETNIPVVPLGLFEVQETVFQSMPVDFMIRYGVMAFELMGRDALVVIMNPYNKPLREKVETLLGRRCHFFLTPPSEFDAMIEKHSHKDAPKQA